MKTSVEIQNLKCSGCSNTIINKLSALEDVNDVSVDIDNSIVCFDHATDAIYNVVKKTLAKFGYPLVDEKNNFGSKAKSYISCAIGIMEN